MTTLDQYQPNTDQGRSGLAMKRLIFLVSVITKNPVSLIFYINSFTPGCQLSFYCHSYHWPHVNLHKVYFNDFGAVRHTDFQFGKRQHLYQISAQKIPWTEILGLGKEKVDQCIPLFYPEPEPNWQDPTLAYLNTFIEIQWNPKL